MTQQKASVTSLEVLARERAKLKLVNLAHNTRLHYGYAWREFQQWCASMSRDPLPATAETVSLFVTDMLACRGWKVSTVAHRAAAIAERHRTAGFPSPVSREARELMTGAKRQRGEQPRQMRPLEVSQLRAITKALMSDQCPLSTRNRAMLVMGFASGLRGASLCELTMEDVSFVTQGVLVRVRKEKQDQKAKGRYLGLPPGKNVET